MSDQHTPAEATITVLEAGPLKVDGGVRILAADGTVLKEGESAFLCRCGQSGNKPFCDGTHRKVGFTGE